EQEGTYPLPEAQVDRFMLKVRITYPGKSDERRVLDRMAGGGSGPPEITPVIGIDQVAQLRTLVEQIYIDEKIRDYIVDIVHATRKPEDFGLDATRLIEFGASPRATIALAQASRARAFLDGRGFVSPQDVKSIGMEVLRHRVLASYEAEAEGLTSDDIVRMIFDSVPVP
ncbi:MAG: MoxR family ATPase, partial [Phycisphaerales bacterium]|nr:MoxR family ATPase [Phycisphaerales bacterium]